MQTSPIWLSPVRTRLPRTFIIVALLALSTPALAADTYKVDGDHAFVVFRVPHFSTGAVFGRFRTLTGQFTLGTKASDHSVSIEVAAASVYTGNKKRDEHIKSPDFLNVKQFPKITFKSSKVIKRGKTHLVSGALKFHGVTKQVTVPMKQLGAIKDPWGNQRTGFEGTLKISRKDFGLTKMQGPVGDQIVLTIVAEGTKK